MGPFLGGMFVGWIVVVWLSTYPGSYRTMAVDALEECQKTLPRNQSCVIIAVPKEVKK